jgi:hypothetical protein
MTFDHREVGMTLPDSLRASAQHITLLQDKRRRLADIQVSAEQQFLAALRRECEAGQTSWAQLRDAYAALSAGQVRGLRARWMDAISISPEKVIANAEAEAARRPRRAAGAPASAPRRVPPVHLVARRTPARRTPPDQRRI